MWAQILEHSSFGVTDGFIAVGGDSLKAVNLIAAVETEFDVRLSPTQLFDAPTIEKQAHVILQEHNFQQKCKSEDPIFPMREGGSSTPLFCFPGNSGEIADFHALVERLDAVQGVNIVLYNELARSGETPRTMEEFAASSLQAIQNAEPTGPYRLAGFCFGASVGYEVARQLRAAGEEVATLALLELEPGFASWPWRQKMTRRWKELTGWIRSFVQHRRPADPPQKEALGFLADRIARIQTVAHPLLKNYKHRRYDGRVLFFHAAQGSAQAYLTYWRDLVGDLEAFSVPGGDCTMLHEPNVSVLAEILQKRL